MLLKLDGPLMIPLKKKLVLGSCGSLWYSMRRVICCARYVGKAKSVSVGGAHCLSYVIIQLDAQVEANYAGEKGFSLIVGWEQRPEEQGRKKPQVQNSG